MGQRRFGNSVLERGRKPCGTRSEQSRGRERKGRQEEAKEDEPSEQLTGHLPDRQRHKVEEGEDEGGENRDGSAEGA